MILNDCIHENLKFSLSVSVSLLLHDFRINHFIFFAAAASRSGAATVRLSLGAPLSALALLPSLARSLVKLGEDGLPSFVELLAGRFDGGGIAAFERFL